MNILKIAAAAVLVAGGATLALAQTQAPSPNTTQRDSPSKSEPGAVQQGPAPQVPEKSGSGSRPIGPPVNPAEPAPGRIRQG